MTYLIPLTAGHSICVRFLRVLRLRIKIIGLTTDMSEQKYVFDLILHFPKTLTQITQINVLNMRNT